MNDLKSLVFCTGYAWSIDWWQTRYFKWLRGINIAIKADHIVIIDDGSPVLPNWEEFPTITNYSDIVATQASFIFHFKDNLGRSGKFEYPGWHRSFCAASSIASALGCRRIIHIESDAFVLSRRFADFMTTADGWQAPRIPSKNIPESGLQTISPEAYDSFAEFCRKPYSEFTGDAIETNVPFTAVTDDFQGDRYGEFRSDVPWIADWTMQVPQDASNDINYFWFLRRERLHDISINPVLEAHWIEHGRSFAVWDGGVGWSNQVEGRTFWLSRAASGRFRGPYDNPENCARALAPERHKWNKGKLVRHTELPEMTQIVRSPAVRTNEGERGWLVTVGREFQFGLWFDDRGLPRFRSVELDYR